MHFFAFFSHIYIIIISTILAVPAQWSQWSKHTWFWSSRVRTPPGARLDKLQILEKFQIQTNFRQKNRVSVVDVWQMVASSLINFNLLLLQVTIVIQNVFIMAKTCFGCQNLNLDRYQKSYGSHCPTPPTPGKRTPSRRPGCLFLLYLLESHQLNCPTELAME